MPWTQKAEEVQFSAQCFQSHEKPHEGSTGRFEDLDQLLQDRLKPKALSDSSFQVRE